MNALARVLLSESPVPPAFAGAKGSRAQNDTALATHSAIWRGTEHAAIRAEATGFARIDRRLPGGGLPVGALTELYPAAAGIGEFSLLLPLIARFTQEGRRVVLVAPPYIPYSQALAWHGVSLSRLVLLQPGGPSEVLWAMEHALASHAVAMVVAWPRNPSERELRRLQLSAETGEAIAVLYRAPGESKRSSPAALRIRMQAESTGLALDVFKCRGGQPSALSLPETGRASDLHRSRFRLSPAARP